jgi:ATP-dependent RNA helicase DHX33
VGCILGGLVGYTVRFDDKSSPTTRLKYMTDGALLAEMLGDRDLDRYDIIILDEAHERSLRTDMLMGFLKDVQKRRKATFELWEKERKGKGTEARSNFERLPSPLKVVVMSATIDAKRFSDFFNRAPVLFVKGRQYKVTTLYAEQPQADYCDAALKTIFSIHMSRPPGDVLVFLPGQDDIESLAASIRSYLPDLQKSHGYKNTVSEIVCVWFILVRL